MEQIDATTYRLTSGRFLHALSGVIGIAKGTVLSGYDELPVDDWTSEERTELADFMIEQWRGFKQGSTTEDGFVVISDTDDGTAVFARDGEWLPADVSSDHRRTHARTFSSIGDAWTFLNKQSADWWLAAPGARPRVVQAW
jgi:hypothetical protein